jgi:uncharacterized OsmC-like protein/fermentation-respiration switch protein FrsA (DUF1100 family)
MNFVPQATGGPARETGLSTPARSFEQERGGYHRPMNSQTIDRIEFRGAQGDMLAARLDRPLTAPRAFALFAHCFTCSKDLLAAARISRGLAARGIAVLRFDFTGLGHSDGEFANTNFSSNVADLLHAANWLREEYEAPSLLVGHSLGGAAVLAAAGEIPEVRAVATIGAPADPGHVRHVFGDLAEVAETEGSAEVTLAGRPFTVTRQFLRDIASQSLTRRIADLDRALLVMHAPLDRIVGVDNAAEIYAAARHPKSFISLDDADHLLTRRADADYAATVLAAWADRYLPEAEDDLEAEAAPGEVVVAEAGTGKFVQEVRSGRHALIADEPAALGGDDAGPGPYEFLLTSLGACTSMTLRMYADRKEIPLEGVTVRLRHEKVDAEIESGEADAKRKVDQITRRIELAGDLSPEQHRRLLEIADRCPVHRSLEAETRIRTFADSGS